MILSALANQFHFVIHVTPTLLGALFFLLLLVWAIDSWVLHYHWTTFGTDLLENVKLHVLYFVGSGILIGLACLFFGLYSLSSS
jgi:uncharacterized protein YacL